MTTDKKWTCLAIAIACACLAGQSEQGAQAGLSVKPLTGDFVVPLARQIRTDQDAQKMVIDFTHAQLQEQNRLKEQAARRVAQINSDDPEADKWSAAELQADEEGRNRQLHAILALCKDTEGTDAGLTSVLLLAAYSSHVRPKDQRPNLTPITNALGIIHRDFPDTWQGKVAPLLQATLMKETIFKSRQRTADSLLPVIDWLTQNMPSQEEVIDLKRPDVEAFLAIYPIQSPIKANYLRSMAYTQFQMGSAAGLEDAMKSCAEIIRLYPDGEHAEWARWLVDQIAALRESMR